MKALIWGVLGFSLAAGMAWAQAQPQPQVQQPPAMSCEEQLRVLRTYLESVRQARDAAEIQNALLRQQQEAPKK